jgi:hypothetical protein
VTFRPRSLKYAGCAWTLWESGMRVLNFFIVVSGLTTMFGGIALMSVLFTSVLQSSLHSRPLPTTLVQN